MKKKNIFKLFLAFVMLLTISEGCRKPKEPVKPIDPCANKVLVKALQQDYHNWAHFEVPSQTETGVWLYAVNWDSWSSKVVSGRQYRIAYEEVQCPENHMYNKTMNCYAHPLKCIKITCLEECKPRTQPSSCLLSEVNAPGYEDYFTHGLKGTGISGNSLKMKIGFSGCDRSQMNKFRLSILETRQRCPTPKMSRVFLAKAVTDDMLICQAYFEEEICFDLSTLKDYIVLQDYDLSEPVVIRVQYRDGTDEDFIYKF
jgi:hypothetical protein